MDAAAPRILIVADDLTGAMDAAGPFASAGLPTRVVARPAALDAAALAGARVVSVNTESRRLSPGAAADRVREACACVAAGGFEVVVKKVDSTLRGNVVAETLAALEACARRRALMAPAFPAQGRTVRGGVVRVRGTPLADTAFARDALSPALALPLGEAFAAAPVTVVDGETDRDLDLVAAKALGAAGETLMVGSAGLTAALARALAPQAGGHSGPACSGRVLYVVGSRAAATREQCERLEAGGAAVLRAPDGQWSSAAPRDCDLVLLATAGDPACPADARAVAARLAEAALGLAQDPGVAAVVATGGDTALALLERAGVSCLEVGGELMPGIAFARLPLAGASRWLVTKAGGFGDREALAAIGTRLRAPAQAAA
jgi:uncharacterized protein YgbK (DUF1537 family)